MFLFVACTGIADSNDTQDLHDVHHSRSVTLSMNCTGCM